MFIIFILNINFPGNGTHNIDVTVTKWAWLSLFCSYIISSEPYKKQRARKEDSILVDPTDDLTDATTELMVTILSSILT